MFGGVQTEITAGKQETRKEQSDFLPLNLLDLGAIL